MSKPTWLCVRTLENKKNMKKINFVTRHKGGGGGVTNVESVPAWAQPYVQKAMGAAAS